MPLTDAERALLRFESGDDETTLPDAILDMLFTKASTEYSAYSREVWLQAIRVKRYQNLVATYRRDVTYKQNETSENLSDIAKGYAQDLKDAQDRLDELIAKEKSPPVLLGRQKRIPTQRKDMP